MGHAEHNPQPGVFGTTDVTVIPGTVLHGLVGDKLDVHCHHHQSVVDHPGFEPSAWSEDGTLEAMERVGERLLIAVQWHPEVAEDAGLFRGLVRAAEVRVESHGDRWSSSREERAAYRDQALGNH